MPRAHRRTQALLYLQTETPLHPKWELGSPSLPMPGALLARSIARAGRSVHSDTADEAGFAHKPLATAGPPGHPVCPAARRPCADPGDRTLEPGSAVHVQILAT